MYNTLNVYPGDEVYVGYNSEIYIVNRYGSLFVTFKKNQNQQKQTFNKQIITYLQIIFFY